MTILGAIFLLAPAGASAHSKGFTVQAAHRAVATYERGLAAVSTCSRVNARIVDCTVITPLTIFTTDGIAAQFEWTDLVTRFGACPSPNSSTGYGVASGTVTSHGCYTGPLTVVAIRGSEQTMPLG